MDNNGNIAYQRKENVILNKSKAFAVNIVRLCQSLQSEKHEYILSKQILRSGTSIGANAKEAINGSSNKDFGNKMTIALKEAGETEYWLEILFETDYISKEQFDSLINDCRELIKILTSIINTIKKSMSNDQQRRKLTILSTLYYQLSIQNIHYQLLIINFKIMIRDIKFESQERRMENITKVLNSYGIASIEEANKICDQYGIDPYLECEQTQNICFENAKWAYVVGAAIAIKKGCKTAAEAAEAIGEGLQAFCIKGSVADDRKVGRGHGNLAARLLSEETQCFAFLAGHESFAAAEGAIKIAEMANKVRKNPLRVILNGLGKDAAMIISRINGFTYVQTEFDYYTGELKEVRRKAYSNGPRAKVNCYGADDVREGVAIMWKEDVDVSITGNSTNPTRFQHPVAGTYKKERILAGKKYFSVASGGGTGRTLHPDNMAAGPASYGMTDTMGRMHSDAQFAGSSSVPAHVEMMGFLGMGNNPMVGATVAVAVSVEEAMKK